MRTGTLNGNIIILFFFTNSKSDKKHKFSIKFEVIKFFLGCLNFRPRNSKILKTGFQKMLLQIIETFPLLPKFWFTSSISFNGSTEY